MNFEITWSAVTLFALLVMCAAFTIFGLLVGYVAGLNRGYETGYEAHKKLPFLNAPELDYETRLGHQESLPQTWVREELAPSEALRTVETNGHADLPSRSTFEKRLGELSLSRRKS